MYIDDLKAKKLSDVCVDLYGEATAEHKIGRASCRERV